MTPTLKQIYIHMITLRRIPVFKVKVTEQVTDPNHYRVNISVQPNHSEQEEKEWTYHYALTAQ